MAAVEAVKLLDGPTLYKAGILGESPPGLHSQLGCWLLDGGATHGDKLASPKSGNLIKVRLPLGKLALSSSDH